MKIRFLIWFLLLHLLTVLFGLDVALASGECQSDQQFLLVQLKNNLTFDLSKSTKLVTWNSSRDCCHWTGVTCDGDGRVIGLNLSDESISGGTEKADALFSLHYLQNLDLSYNKFNGTFSAGFANLTSLISLNMSNAGFVDQIPIEISHMTKLVTLDLSVSYSPGFRSLKLEQLKLATLVRNLMQLKQLYLDGVNISAHGNEWCQALSSSLPNLQELSLSNCFLSGSIHPSLANLHPLSVIRLNGNNFSGPVPEFFAKFSNLRILSLSNCELQGTFPANIFQVSTLEILDISYNQELEGNLPDSLPENASLKTLVLSNTNFSGTLPESIGNLRNLSRIELGSCLFTGPIPSSLANLSGLVYLDFSSNMFTGPIPSFNRSKNLFYIDLSRNKLSGEIKSTQWEGHRNLSHVDFSNNLLNGSIPSSLFAIPSLKKIQLSSNQFGGHVPNFSKASFSLLDTLDLSSNKLEGSIPSTVFDLTRLNVLLLSSNNFNGTVQLESIQKLSNLTRLELSYNKLTVEGASNSTLSSFLQVSTIKLASCNLSRFPHLSNQSKLVMLDLSDNQITGVVPHWIWKVGNGSLRHLNLSHNLLDGLEQPYSIPNLYFLDLHCNRLKGRIPILPQSVSYVDYSSNNFSVIPDDIGTNLSQAIFFSLSNNSLAGVIPISICNATSLQVLDLSNNGLNGTVPACLIERSENLGILNLRRNHLSGNVPDNFTGNCKLETLDLSGNLLEGHVPQSLINCTMLEVLDLGNNKFHDRFPCLLMNISNLRVLVLRDNMFYGNLTSCQKNAVKWERLQIVDIASNNFSGPLPNEIFTKWKAMMGDGNEPHDHLKFEFLRLGPLYYQDSVTVTSKGLEMNLVKILTIFTSIDVSKNNFVGQIPERLGQLNALYVLNLSHNALVGQIPSSLGNISQLESLDLSANKLGGKIPQQLAYLTFLSVLNLSNNMLFGRIPTSTQLQSFLADSYAGNSGLCGAPLPEKCPDTSASPTAGQQNPRNEFDWQFIVPGLGFGLGAGAVVAPLMLSKKINKWCDSRVDKILMVLLPVLGLMYYTSNDWRIATEETFEEDATDVDDNDIDEEEYDFGGRYCVFCTKLDITRKRAIHDPKCTCYQSPPISSSTSPSSSLSSSTS